MKIDRIIQQSFSGLIQNGFLVKKSKACMSINYCLYRESLRIEVSIDLREETIDFKIKSGTTVLLLIESEEVMINAPFEDLNLLMATVHDEYIHIRNSGITTKQLQNTINAFTHFLLCNWELLNEHRGN